MKSSTSAASASVQQQSLTNDEVSPSTSATVEAVNNKEMMTEGEWDAFATSPFNDIATNGGDAFGFPKTTTSPERIDTDAFFVEGGVDAWGEPSAQLPVDFTPRKTNAGHFRKDPDNSDAMSYDASEMSEVTNPTFAGSTVHTRPDQESDDVSKHSNAKKVAGTGASANHNRTSSQGSSSQEQSESAVPLLAEGNSSGSGEGGDAFARNADGTGSQKENDGDTLATMIRGNKLPPLYSSEKRGVINPFNLSLIHI